MVMDGTLIYWLMLAEIRKGSWRFEVNGTKLKYLLIVFVLKSAMSLFILIR